MNISIEDQFEDNNKENEINNINEEFYQVKYEESLSFIQKAIYNGKKKGYCCCSIFCFCSCCCCCGKSHFKFMNQFLSLYIILCFLIFSAKVYQIGSFNEYNIVRNELLSKINLFTLGYEPCFHDKIIDNKENKTCSDDYAYVINYSSAIFFINFKNYESNILFTSFILLSFSLIISIIYNKIITKYNPNGVYYYIILILLMILYAIFAIISVLFCYFHISFFNFFIKDQFYIKTFSYQNETWNEEFSSIYTKYHNWLYNYLEYAFVIITSSQISWVISIFSLFLLIPIKNLIISHINFENNELNEKYKKISFYLKDKIFDIEINIDDELVLKSGEEYYLFKEVKIKEIKENDNIYILINNDYIKDELSVTDLKIYNMNIQIYRLGDLINLIIVILIILIGLFNIFSKNEYEKIFYDNPLEKKQNLHFSFKLYPLHFQVYKYFEYYIEISEFIICLIMLLFYCFCFFKRLFTGGIKHQYLISIYKLIFKIFIVFNYIYMFLSLFLSTYGFFEYHINYYHELLTNFILTKILIHSILNFIIIILYIVIIFKNFRLIKYINNIEKEMNLFYNENNNPTYIEFIDLYNIKQRLKSIIYNNYQINLFYELERGILKNQMKEEDSVIINLKE